MGAQMTQDELRIYAQKLLQESATLSRQSADKQFEASEILGQLEVIGSPAADKRVLVPSEFVSELYDPPMSKWWGTRMGNVSAYSDGTFEVITRPTDTGSEHVIQNAFIKDTPREYEVEQTVTLLEPFSWSKGKHIGGKLGMGLASYEQVSGGIESRGGWSVRFGFRDGRVILYVYHQNRPTKWGQDYDLGVLEVGVPVTVKMRVRVNSTFAQSDGVLKGWYNGELVVHKGDMLYQSASSVPREGKYDLTNAFVVFSLFHGGNTEEWSPSFPSLFRFQNVRHGLSL